MRAVTADEMAPDDPRSGIFVTGCQKQETGEWYLFFWDHDSRLALLETLWKFAENPELSLSYRDATRIAARAMMAAN